ncbi:hypothetical protein OAL55_00850 [Verrucomicrobiales bacterium]|nr:hypothetical protein [Verrucomicrobiales bacterium]
MVFLSAVLNSQELVDSSVKELLFEPNDSKRNRVVPVKVYLPAESKSPLPVILFSHGLGGSRMNSVYLGLHWAKQGFVCVFMQHHGSDESVWKDARPADRMSAMKGAANLKSTLDRFDDVPFVIDQLERWNADKEHPLVDALDLEHIGMCGHSFGAVTTQAMMGQKFRAGRTVSDPRLDAFFAMSPSEPRGGTSASAFAEIKKPFLGMTGTKDGSPISPKTTPASRREVYKALPLGDKFELVFEGAEHSAFSDAADRAKNRIPHHHLAIQKISTKFWDAYLKNDESAKKWLQSNQPKKDEGLFVEKDIWAWK